MKRILSARGFSLIETITLLVIVGVVIGGIWLAYSSINRQKQNALEDRQITDLVSFSRDYLQQFNEYDTEAYNVSGAPRNITPELLNTADRANGAVLPGSLRPGIVANTIETEFGQVRVWALRSTRNPYDTGPMIRIIQTGVTQKNCLVLLNNWGGSSDRIQSSGMVAVIVNADSDLATDISGNNLFADPSVNGEGALPPALIETSCAAASNDITFLFRVNK